LINKSFQLLKTNPALTSNVRVVVTSDYKLYFEAINSNKELNATKYKHFGLSKSSLIEDKINEFYDGLSPNLAFEVKYDNDVDIMYNDFRNQFDDTYLAGAKNVEDQWYSEEFEYFAPLFVRKTDLPDNFIILRVDDPAVYKLESDKYRIQGVTKDNFRTEIIDKWKCVSVFDMQKTSDLGVFLANNITENSRFPIKSFELDIKKYNFSRWFGYDYDTGIFTEKSLILDDKLYYETPDFRLEKFITEGFKNNNLIYPHILNLKFLFDDTPATPDTLKKWSMNRYYGFYIDSMEKVEKLTPYVTPDVRTDIKLVNNIIIKEYTSVSVNPFSEWDETISYYIYINNDLHKVKRILENSVYVYKVISDTKLDDIFDPLQININTVTINYSDSDGRSYINSVSGDLIINSYVDNSGRTNSMDGDLFLIDINGKYHVLKNSQSLVGGEYVNRYYIQTDYAINSTSVYLEYWIGGKSSEYYVKTNVMNSNTDIPPLTYQIYRVKFSDIKDFDFDRVHTHYSDFDYEKSFYYKTNEIKLYATEYRDGSDPKDYKLHEYGEDGQYEIKNLSSEYIATDELFEITANHKDLTSMCRKNQSICKWGYEGSNSHCDYPYKLNNSLRTGSVFNRTVNPFKYENDEVNKTHDYFYRVGHFNSSVTYTSSITPVYYYKQTTNITTDYLDQTLSSKFNLDLYLNSEMDYFSYFFKNKELYYDFGLPYERIYEKYSIINSGDKYQNSSTLFKGLKFNIFGVSDFQLSSDNLIKEVLIDDTKKFNDYKFTILLSEYYRRFDSSGTLIEEESRGLQNNSVIDVTKNGIHVILNEKHKNILIIINLVVPILNTIGDFNNLCYLLNEKYGLYYAKQINGSRIDDFTATLTNRYNPTLLTANNFSSALNNMNDKCQFENYINYYYVNSDGVSGKTMVTDYSNSTLSNVSGWLKKVPPFIINVEFPTELILKKNSYNYVGYFGPDHHIYGSYNSTNPNLAIRRSSEIDDYLARIITINENEIKPRSQVHQETLTYNYSIYRYSGSYEPIFKSVEMFNPYTIVSGNTYYRPCGYYFDDSYTRFGMVDEVIFSKVNRKGNILMLRNAENDKSIYPMVDEYGYQYRECFIFKSGWDDELFIETDYPII
jgi:hypothetical protein